MDLPYLKALNEAVRPGDKYPSKAELEQRIIQTRKTAEKAK